MKKRMLLTKEAPKRQLAKRQAVELAWMPATDVEMQKALGSDNIPDGYVAGWASTPDLDHYRHVVQEGAFDESVTEKGLTGPKGIKLLIGHDRYRPGGVIKVLKSVQGKLWIEAQLNLKLSYVRDVYEIAKMNGGLSFSVGFFLQDYEFKEDENENEYLLIKRGELEEVSVVVFPGNAEATMTFVKGIEDDETFDSISEFEKALVASGLAKSRNAAHQLTRVVKRNAALFQADPAPTPPVLATTKALDDLQAQLSALQDLFK